MSQFELEYKKIKQKTFNVSTLNVQLFCDRILQKKSIKDKQKVDAMLELDALLYMNLGYGSTKTEKNETKKASRVIYRSIKKINNAIGESFLSHMDKE